MYTLEDKQEGVGSYGIQALKSQGSDGLFLCTNSEERVGPAR